jgi:hypothetical protein
MLAARITLPISPSPPALSGIGIRALIDPAKAEILRAFNTSYDEADTSLRLQLFTKPAGPNQIHW